MTTLAEMIDEEAADEVLKALEQEYGIKLRGTVSLSLEDGSVVELPLIALLGSTGMAEKIEQALRDHLMKGGQ